MTKGYLTRATATELPTTTQRRREFRRNNAVTIGRAMLRHALASVSLSVMRRQRSPTNGTTFADVGRTRFSTYRPQASSAAFRSSR